VSVYPAGGCWAVCVASWVWALAISTLGFMGAVVPVWAFVPVCAISTVHAACYSGAAGNVAVALAAWVVSLYCRMFFNYF
jgi:hypothetical protein